MNPERPLVPACAQDYRVLAQKKLPSFLFGYLDGGSLAETTLRDNVDAWARQRLRQFVLRDVSAIDTKASFFGQDAAMPLALAPVGLGGLMGRRGEVQAARAAEAAGVPFTLCTPSLCSIEEVRAATTAPFWFQLYMLRDRGIVRELLARAKAAQCSALLFTVDLARVGLRRSDIRHGMNSAPTPRTRMARIGDVLGHPRWLWDVPVKGSPLVFGNLSAYVPAARNLEAFKAWVDAQFSNHGGRQLDGAPASADVLPRVVDALASLASAGTRRCTVLVDGGIRQGSDLVKARALGADGALIGRPWAWALAARGQAGVADLLELLRAELGSTLGLMGLAGIDAVNRSALAAVVDDA